MPVIRPYQQETSPQGQISGRRAIASDFGGDGLAQLGNAVSNFGQVIQKQQEDQEISDVRKRIAEARGELTEKWINTTQTAKPGDLTIADKFSQDTTQYFDKMRESITTPGARRVFEQSAAEMNGHFRGNALMFQADQAGKKARLDFSVGREANARTIAADPSQYDQIVAQDRRALEEGQGPLGNLNPLDRQAIGVETLHTYARAATASAVERDPMGVLRAIKPEAVSNRYGVPIGGAVSGSGFDPAVKWVLSIEGGYVAKDGKSGAPANGGINQRANPDLDVAKLTDAQKIQVYKDRYWDKIGADSLPPATAMVAFDAAVNQGPGVVQKLIAQSGGDPTKMIELRRQMYKNLAANDPEHAKQLGGWMARMDKLEKQLPGLTQPSLADELEAKGSAPKINVPGFNDLPFNEQLQMIRTAETRANQIMSDGRAVMGQRMKDIEAEALSTGKVTNPPSKSELVNYFGPAEGMRIYDNVLKTVQLGQDMSMIKGMSPVDQEALVKRYTPGAGEGFAGNLQRQETLARAVQVARQQRDADPAQYTYHAVPEVKAKMDAMLSAQEPDQRKAATQAYATTMLAQQKRLGVADPVLLPKNMEDQIIRTFSEQAQGGQNASMLVRDLQNTWGDHFAKVYEQLAPKLPAAALVIPGMADAPATLLAEASKLSKKELWDGMDPDVKKRIDTELTEVMVPFQQSVLGSPQGPKSYSLYQEQASILAAMYVRGGEKPEAAAKRAYEEIQGKNFTFTNTYRIPKVSDQQPVNADLVQAGARSLLSNVENMDLKVARSGTPGTTVESDRKAFASAILSKGHWVTSGRDKGLTLYYGDAAVEDVNGNPIQFTWNDLQERAKAATPTIDKLIAERQRALADGDKKALRVIENDIAKIRMQERGMFNANDYISGGRANP